MARAITGQVQQALSDCNQSLDLQPNDANACDGRAFVYLKMGKLEDAITDYNVALGLKPSLAASRGQYQTTNHHHLALDDRLAHDAHSRGVDAQPWRMASGGPSGMPPRCNTRLRCFAPPP
jgi:tetratricopeptide (TPR) repeat protein